MLEEGVGGMLVSAPPPPTQPPVHAHWQALPSSTLLAGCLFQWPHLPTLTPLWVYVEGPNQERLKNLSPSG